MIGTLVLYGLAFVGALSLITAVGVAVFTWRLPERTDPGVIDEQRHEFEHAQWRNNVQVYRVAPADYAAAKAATDAVRDAHDRLASLEARRPDGAA